MASRESQRYQQILTQILKNSSSSNGPRSLTDQPMGAPDVSDEAVVNHCRYVANIQESILRSIQEAARQALARLEDGEYGQCADCGEPINPKRLAAVPWTDCCVACQAARENFMPLPSSSRRWLRGVEVTS